MGEIGGRVSPRKRRHPLNILPAHRGTLGVGGGIVAVVPGKMAIAAFSPRLDAAGNPLPNKVVELRLPALRERREDIPLLCQYFLDTFAERDGRPAKRLSRAAMERLLGHGLPGNVRQLEHLLLQAWVMVDGATIEATDLALDGMGAPAPEAPPQPDVRGIVASAMPPTPEAIDPAEVPVKSRAEYQDAEKVRILAALEDHGWNRARAAKALGIPRRTFYRRLQQYGIQ